MSFGLYLPFFTDVRYAALIVVIPDLEEVMRQPAAKNPNAIIVEAGEEFPWRVVMKVGDLRMFRIRPQEARSEPLIIATA